MKHAVRRVQVAGLISLFAAALATAQDQDLRGSKDHPLVSRYPGSVISGYIQKEFDDYKLLLGKVIDGRAEKTQRVDGKVTGIYYETQGNRSALEVFRNYTAPLQGAGFQTLFACSKACGSSPPPGASPLDDAFGNYSGDAAYYLAAKLSRSQGDVYVALWVYDSGFGIKTFLTVVEARPMESGLITVNAESLANDISRTGHSTVYGIYFDSGKADVKPESDAALKEIAKLLQQDPKLKLYVVGHTDNQGPLDMNLDLSRRRANAATQILTVKYAVAATRLSAQGDGPTAPVASNDTEEGRAKNRRVELVKQ